MTDSKLIKILSVLTKDELKSFEKFILSPFFGSGRNVSDLFSILKKYYPAFAEKKISKENIIKELFPGDEFNEKKLKNLVIALTSLADEFLIQLRLGKSSDKKEQMLAYEYKDRKLDKYYLSSVRAIDAQIKNSLFTSHECFTKEEELEKLKQEYYVDNNQWEEFIDSKIRYSEFFIISFIIRYSRTIREKCLSEREYNIKYNSKVINAFEKSVDVEKFINTLLEGKYKYSYLLEIHYHNLRCSVDPLNEESFWKLRELVLNNLPKFSRSEKYMLFSDLVGICADKEKYGIKNFTNTEFDLYKDLLKNEAYSWSAEDYMQIIMFRNIMFISLQLKEYRWLEWFTENYIEKIKPEYRDNMKNLVLANVKYSERSFEEALSYISKVKYDIFIFKVDVKNLMLKIYYELSLFEEAFYLIDTYRHYLSDSNDLSDSNKIQHTNFLSLYNRLLKSKSTGNTEELDYSIKEMTGMELLSSRNWLIEKAKELISKRS